MRLDYLIKNAEIVDGLGTPRYRANLAVKDDVIAYLGSNQPEAAEVIDAEGLIITPGFIDIHTHEDTWLLYDAGAMEKLSQGVTTLIVGNCGFSAAPILSGKERLVREAFPNTVELPWNWTSLSEYLNRLSHANLAINVGTFVGHNTVRLNVMGAEKRPPTAEELDTMKALVSEAMKDGALGLSTGLIYVPGIYSETTELIELSKVVAAAGGIYSSHIRGEASTLKKAVQEALNIGREAGIPVEISHHKAVGRDNWGNVKETLKMIENARAEGVDVNCDVYPYNAGNTGLGTLIPSWVFADGPVKTNERLTNRINRTDIIKEMMTASAEEERPLVETGAESIMISYCKDDPSLEGRTLAEIAQMRGSSPAETVLDLVREHGGLMHSILVILYEMSEEDVETVIRHPLSMIASDSVNTTGKPHPRVFGTYSRVLAKYVREKRILTLEEAVQKMTSMPAKKIGLADRGVLKEGKKADLAIFDSSKVQDRATFSNSNQLSEGVKYVFVNGKKAWQNGGPTSLRGGLVLTSTTDAARGR
jgi:N-acyl-D-amino-acid deacylase